MTLKLVKPVSPPPASVAIVGLGPSLDTYVDLCRRLGGRKRLADETWGVNALGDVIACDRVFHMDSVRIQEVRAAACPDSNIGVMLDWMKRHPGPIYSSDPHPDYPGIVEFPLEAVINDLGEAYFNSTIAYAVAYAIHIGVKEMQLYGVDYSYANSHHAEKGRACVEFWLGVAMERGIKVAIAEASALMDMCDGKPLYGYGAFGGRDAHIDRNEDGRVSVRFTDREALPSAEVIEREYDHSRPSSPLLRAKA